MKRTVVGSSLLAAVACSIFALLAGPASAAVGVGQSGWSWGNPLPQGNEIDSLDFAGSRGYAAGKFGTLLRTDDAGVAWSGIPTGITQDLTKVSIIDPDSLVIAGGCSARRSDDAGDTFKRLPWTASDVDCPAKLVSLDFPVDQTGYLLLSDGSVLATTNGGTSWSRKTALPGTKSTGGTATPTDIAFTSTTTGVATTSSGRIYRSIDGGNSWTLITSASRNAAYNGLFFVDAATGYAVGDASGVWKTADGGATWTEMGNGSLKFTAIRCAGVDQCIITTASGDRVVLTAQDGGPDDKLSFTSVTPSSDKIFAAALTSTTHAVAAGQFGSTVVSNDAGVTWNPVGGRLTATFTRIRGASANVAYATGRNGAAAKTSDGGKSWSNIAGPTSHDVVDIAFPTTNVGYALDDANGVSRTDDGGASWQILNPGTPLPPQAIVAPTVNNVILVGPRGVTRSSDGGDDFERVRGRSIDRAKLFDADLAGKVVFAYGSKVIMASTTGGKTWKKVRMPKRTAIQSLDFVSANVGLLLSQDGRVWKTKNRGRSWKELLGVGSDAGVSISFSSIRSGYIVLSRWGDERNGYVLHTGDGGVRWTPELIASNPVVSIGAAGGTDYALAGDNGLFFTNSGGNQGEASSIKIKTKRKTVKRRAPIKVTGKVSGAQQGEQVLVARRYANDGGWDFTTATIAANGTFTTAWKVKRDSIFVAQFAGDADHSGSGSAILTVKTKRRR